MTAPVAQHVGPTPLQHRTMHRFWRLAGVLEREDRIALTSAAIGVTVKTSSELTPEQAEELIAYQRRLAARGQLAAHAARWLAAHRRTAGADADGGPDGAPRGDDCPAERAEIVAAVTDGGRDA